jgi:hypothetical protein
VVDGVFVGRGFVVCISGFVASFSSMENKLDINYSKNLFSTNDCDPLFSE